MGKGKLKKLIFTNLLKENFNELRWEEYLENILAISIAPLSVISPTLLYDVLI